MNYIDLIDRYNIDEKEKETLYNFILFCIKQLELKNVLFNVIIVNNEEIHELNKLYRNIDKPTDVITFALEDVKDNVSLDIRMLGDIYISYDKVMEQALEYGHTSKREICFLAVHGILHLLGYDHMNKDEEEKMFKLQKELLDKYGIKKES